MILAWINDLAEGVSAFLTGMRTTATFLVENLRGQGGGTAVTRQYPQEPAATVGERPRGHLFNKAEICIVCQACAKACPVDCFTMEMERTGDNKPRASRFDIDLSKCIYCSLCVRACPTDSLSMTAAFEVDPRGKDGRFLFRRNTGQLGKRLETPDVVRLGQLANRPRQELSAEDRAWLDGMIDPTGPHLIGMYGMGYYPAEEKARVDAEREAKKAAKAALAPAAKPKPPAASGQPTAAGTPQEPPK